MGRIIIPGGGNNIDLDVITAAASDILKGKIGIGPDGEPLTGTIPSLSAKTITPGKTNQVLNAGNYLAGNITIAGDADLIAANIKSGKNIFNIAGSCKEYKEYHAEAIATTGRKTFNCAYHGSETYYYVRLSNLGFVPKIAICASDGSWRGMFVTAGWGGSFLFKQSSTAIHQFTNSALGWTATQVDLPACDSGNQWVYVAGY